MARINRTDIIQKAVNDLAISTSTDKVPNETLDKVQLTYDLNRKFCNFVSSFESGTTGSITATTPTISSATQRIFLTSIDCHLIKDATCDLTTGAVNVILTPADQGVTKIIALFSTIALTAQSEHITLALTYPLELKPNTSVIVGGTFSLGVCRRSIAITGFTTSSN
jgi:hypothetical protein